MSLGLLLKKVYKIKMKDFMLTLLNTHGTMITKVTMIKKKYRMFLLNIDMNVPKYLKLYVKYETWFWHMRLEYINFDDLKMMT